MTNAKEFVGKNGNSKLPQRYWDGFSVGANGRLPNGVTMGGGVDLGRNVDDHCFTVDAPNQPRDVTASTGVLYQWNLFNQSGTGMCRAVTSWADNLDFRLHRQHSDQGRLQRAASSSATPLGAVWNANMTVSATAGNVTFKNGRAASTLSNDADDRHPDAELGVWRPLQPAGPLDQQDAQHRLGHDCGWRSTSTTH